MLSSEYEKRLGKVEVLLCIQVCSQEFNVSYVIGEVDTVSLFLFQTVFVILSGQGDQLTIDPVTFYKRIATLALDLSIRDDEDATGGAVGDSRVTAHSVMYAVLKSAFIVRRKKVK